MPAVGDHVYADLHSSQLELTLIIIRSHGLVNYGLGMVNTYAAFCLASFLLAVYPGLFADHNELARYLISLDRSSQLLLSSLAH